jgi:hypothetical protein
MNSSSTPAGASSTSNVLAAWRRPSIICNASIATASASTAHLTTDNELVRNVLLAVISSLAKVEAEKEAALQRALAEGKTFGHRRIDPPIERKARQMLKDGVGMLRIADKLKIGSEMGAAHRS